MDAIEKLAKPNSNIINIPTKALKRSYSAYFKGGNKITNMVTDNLKSPYVKYGLIGFAVIILVYFIYKIYQNKKYNKANPVFIKGGHDGKKYKKFSQKDIPNSLGGNELTTFCWLHINDLKYRYSKIKHIFTKGDPYLQRKSQCPSIWIDSKTNDILIYISNKHFNDIVRVKDIPMQKWFSIGIVIKDNTTNIYMDGDLVVSKSLRAPAKINNGDLHIGKNGGFNGRISSMGMYSEALDVARIKKLHSMGYNRSPYYQRIWDTIKGLFGKIKGSVKIDVSVDTKTE